MKGWLDKLDFFSSDEYTRIKEFLKKERDAGKSILPAEDDVFNALKYTPLDKVKVVIIGQDPYPNKKHAHGLAFSIPKETVDLPQSLRNILKELEDDVEVKASSGNLVKWAERGVMLLNATLTVEEGKSNSHKSIGWNKLTKEVIQLINEKKENVVFILWGNFAQNLGKKLDRSRHLIIESVHPSPLSAYRGFFGSKPFSTTNEYLKKNKIGPIDWSL
ncbi:MAG: uracil-DNA glycosylase [Candidatus Hodarchaeota archaeon]